MRRRHWFRCFAVVGGAAVAFALLPATAGSAETTTIPFSCTGAAQSWEVPAGITEVTVELWGAQGGHGVGSTESDGAGGLGGHVKATIAVTPGETLQVNVGCTGGPAAIHSPGAGGFPDGGAGGDSDSQTNAYGGSGGGGSSDIRQGGTGLAHRVLVAGGGGGGSVATGNPVGGSGGGAAGTAGSNNANNSVTGGGGANGTTPGTGGSGGGAGSVGLGGDGGDNQGNATGWGGSGGGGGLAGGGGGGADTTGNGSAAGGGGSALCATGCLVNEAGIRSGSGRIEISYTTSSSGGSGGSGGAAAPVTTNPNFTG